MSHTSQLATHGASRDDHARGIRFVPEATRTSRLQERSHDRPYAPFLSQSPTLCFVAVDKCSKLFGNYATRDRVLVISSDVSLCSELATLARGWLRDFPLTPLKKHLINPSRPWRNRNHGSPHGHDYLHTLIDIAILYLDRIISYQV